MSVLKRTLDIDAPPNAVWRVLTTPELVEEWASVYQDGLSIRTSWRVGEPVEWRYADGGARASGRIAAFQPDSRLQFDYAGSPANAGHAFSDTYEITPAERGVRLHVETGPVDESARRQFEGPLDAAIREIKSLAEELARIPPPRAKA